MTTGGRRLVLVTNDDGIDSPGLHSLAAAVREHDADVVIAAPAAEASGSSAAITAVGDDDRIVVERRKIQGLEDVPAYAVAAAPALIALIACHGAFGDPPHTVVSGVNRGANVGQAIMHSGTVGAALTAGVNGGRGLAVSLDVGPASAESYWETASTLACQVLEGLLEEDTGTVLNLNVPNVPGDRPPRLRTATLASFGVVQTTMTRRGKDHVQLSVADNPEPLDAGTDAAFLAEGFATITGLGPVCERQVPPLGLAHGHSDTAVRATLPS